jgi:GNAT superfamily N-acetyltransferase
LLRTLHDVKIGSVLREELPKLIGALGDENFFADRLQRQNAGEGNLLVAWSAGQAIGVVFLWTAPAEESEIRTHLPGVPLLNHLEVRAEHRGLGVGTNLVDAAEGFLSERGYQRVALAVTVDNTDAERLYRRLHYTRVPALAEVKCRYDVELADGSRESDWEVCRVLVKDLRVSSGQDRAPTSPYPARLS